MYADVAYDYLCLSKIGYTQGLAGKRQRLVGGGAAKFPRVVFFRIETL